LGHNLLWTASIWEWNGKEGEKATCVMVLRWMFENKICSQFASDGVGSSPLRQDFEIPAKLNAGAMAKGVQGLGGSAGTTTLTSRRGRLVNSTMQDMVCR